jgi:ankyrin repeat protein
MGIVLQREDSLKDARKEQGLRTWPPGEKSQTLLLPPYPQMWACALGHLEAAVLLFRWNRQALSIPDSLGRLPLSVAHSRGHVRLARCLEELQRQEASVELPLALSPPSSSPDTGEGWP